ncbi:MULTISPECIES: response regulator transcription factor [Streptomyces]|uniref:Putative two component system reponse regulator n=1 Tax=Streptomyces scabiei (strain 87.22) TaxID=680198 RepID=C9Z3Y5_STRSW|nr:MULTISPECIES: response regulator transcription factor [Streptomyces]MBP5862196.1 response regulator transcription factor [Streptomyces sp. LBUM 1484]KFG05741.1 transcriptional regulator [Streptomyces scabiei]MBP5877326.1 response regulator transcription factor [Streptomyces sp. LBUM 1477]MBP5885177.1 response regulator transcription factor [Streptomyces sp. LBUM 1487]MBP5892030.1 response regulator transcription factor [Streptomyces sp. LBUM 1481]
MRVLLVEDDEPVAESLRRGLLRYGFEVEWVNTGGAALSYGGPYDVVLLDLGLPDTDGLDVCKALRDRSQVPIIVISARSDETDRVVGLELGADDYVSKPFGVREVIARIRAVMRRVQPRAADAPAGPDRYGPRLTVDRKAARVHLDGTEVGLAPKEYDLLAFLTEEPGALMSREQIMEAVWDANWFGPTKTLDVHVAALRRKLAGAITIEAVRGVGFRLIVNEKEKEDAETSGSPREGDGTS